MLSLLLVLVIFVLVVYVVVVTCQTNKPVQHLTSTIQQNIIQTYKHSTLPPRMLSTVNKLKADNADYRHFYYDDQMCEHFLREHHAPDVLEAFLSVKKGAFKADIFRLAVLYTFGGVYMDICMRSMLANSISKLLDVFETHTEHKLVVVKDKPKGAIYQAFVAATKGNTIVKHILDGTVQRVKCKYVPSSKLSQRDRSISYTGPLAFGALLNTYLGRDEHTAFQCGLLRDDIYVHNYEKKHLSLTKNDGVVLCKHEPVLRTKYYRWQHDRDEHYTQQPDDVYK